MPQNIYIYSPETPVPDNVQHVTVPEGITVIPKNTFRRCTGLQSVTIPDSVTEIGEFAFMNCSALQSVTIPDGVTKIRKGVFYKCENLQSVTIPDIVTEIDDNAFRGCSDLQSVTIPDSVTKIGESAFQDCSGLQSIMIPDSITEIGDSAFADCSGLQSVVIPDSVTEINQTVFYGCSGLQSVTIPDSVTKIGGWAFCGCSALQSVTISDSMTEIGDYAFSGCSDLQSVTIPDSVTEIDKNAFERCSSLQSVTIPDSVTKIGSGVFYRCSALQSLMYKGVNIAPFINTDGYGVNTFSIIKTLVNHGIPLNKNTVKCGIDMARQGMLSQWAQEYFTFGQMHLSPAVKSVDMETKERLRQCFADQKRTKHRIPKILDQLAIMAGACWIPPERLADTFDMEYTKKLLSEKIPIVPATVCRCYYDRDTCNMLIRKDKISVMAEAIDLYNSSGHRECYRHLMDFILSHPDTKIEDLQYAADHAEEIPIRVNTTLAQIGQYRIYMESLAEVTRIETKYGAVVPGFRLSDYPCRLDPVSITYDGMTARVLDLSDERDIALTARLGELTYCGQRLGFAGETAMMHGFLNPDAGFWVIEDNSGNIKAQAEIWKTKNGNLVFDNIEFAGMNRKSAPERAGRIRGAIATWATESGYKDIIMECGYRESLTESMEPAPAPKLCLTPEEVFTLQKGNDAEVSFRNIDAARQYMQTEQYSPDDFVHTGMTKRCVYIKKDGRVADYLMRDHNVGLTDRRFLSESKTATEQGSDTDYR